MVGEKAGVASEAASAVLAAEGAFARVHPLVVHQRLAATEALPTFPAGVGCLAAPGVPREWGSSGMGPWGPLLAGAWGFHRSILLPVLFLLD